MEPDRGRGGARAGGRHGAPLPPGDLPRQPRVRRHVSGARDAGGQGRGRAGHVAGLQHLPGMQPLLQVPRYLYYLHYLLCIYTIYWVSTLSICCSTAAACSVERLACSDQCLQRRREEEAAAEAARRLGGTEQLAILASSAQLPGLAWPILVLGSTLVW